MLNPVLAYFSFLGVLYTIWINKRSLTLSQEELRLSREEMSRATAAQLEQTDQIRNKRLESTFFSLLHQLRELAQDVIIDKPTLTERGFLKDEAFVSETGKLALREILLIFFDIRKSQPAAEANIVAQEVFNKIGDLIDFYFDTVNVALRFLISTDLDERDFYIDLLVSQMTTDELILLFYYSLRNQGEELRQNMKQSNILSSLSPELLALTEKDALWLKNMQMIAKG